MSVKLGEYFRGFKPSDSTTPKLPNTSQTAKLSKSWGKVPIRMFVDCSTGEDKGVLLVGFSPRLRYVSRELAQEILKKYSNFKRIKFLPKRFLPVWVEERIEVPIDLLIG